MLKGIIFLNTLARDRVMPLIDLRAHQQPNKHSLLLPWEKKATILNTSIMITSPSLLLFMCRHQWHRSF